MLSSLVLVPVLLFARLDSPVTDQAEALGKLALSRANEPRGAAALIRLHGLMDEVDDLNLLAEPYFTIAARGSTDANVRVLARMLLVDLERARGRSVRSQDIVRDLGFVQDWYVVGAFDNEGKGGCDTDFGPEAAPDLKTSYPAKGHEVGWRKLVAKSYDGSVDLSVPLRPSTEVVGYALVIYFLSLEFDGRVGVLDEFFLEPSRRCKGLGSWVLGRLKAELLSAGIRVLRLEVDERHREAANLYRRHGLQRETREVWSCIVESGVVDT